MWFIFLDTRLVMVKKLSTLEVIRNGTAFGNILMSQAMGRVLMEHGKIVRLIFHSVLMHLMTLPLKVVMIY